MPSVVDDRGVRVDLAKPPRAIVSLVPSTTETLHALGLAEQIVGVTRFCVRPAPWVESLPKVGGTKDPDIQRILDLAPDLVVANCEENTREAFEALEGHGIPVYAALPKTVDDATADLRRLATLLGQADAGDELAVSIEEQRQKPKRLVRGAYLIWRNPWMAVSDDTFIASMLREVGVTNVFGHHRDRFPTITTNELAEADPDVVLLSSEPFPFRERHREELASATGLPPERFRFIDGQACSWHGVRMREGIPALRRALGSRQ